MFAEITDEIEDLARERIGQGFHLLVNEFGDSHFLLLVNAGSAEIISIRRRVNPDDKNGARYELVGEATLVGDPMNINRGCRMSALRRCFA
jgi:hypothetical protein